MARATWKVCNRIGCPTLTDTGSRCDAHRSEYVPRARGGYDTAGHARFRRAVLARNPVCVKLCGRLASEADHYPRSRRTLLELGLNANDPQYGRGLCKQCHSRETAVHQPGGWLNPRRVTDASAFE